MAVRHTRAALIIDWNPDPQRRLTVRAGTGIGIPTMSAACLAMYAASLEDLKFEKL